MIKYKLIKKYPGSPSINPDQPVWAYLVEKGVRNYVYASHYKCDPPFHHLEIINCELHPEFWEAVEVVNEFLFTSLDGQLIYEDDTIYAIRLLDGSISSAKANKAMQFMNYQPNDSWVGYIKDKTVAESGTENPWLFKKELVEKYPIIK